MTWLRGIFLGTLALAPLLSPSTAAGQEPAGREPIRVEPYEVGTAVPPTAPGQSLVTFTLEEALARADGRNLDIQNARLNPSAQRFSLYAATGAYKPVVSGTYSFTNQDRASTSQLDGGALTNTKRQVYNLQVAQQLPWLGGDLTTTFNNSRVETNNQFATLNPSYTSSLRFSLNQPLLAGLKIDNQRAQVETQELQGEIVDLQARSTVENISFDVRETYWGLKAAIEQIEIQRRNLALAEQLLAENQIRVQLGQMTEVDIAQTEAQVANAQQALLNAEIQWRNQELALKQMLVEGAGDPLLFETINPTDLPEPVEEEVDIQAAVQRALSQRTDIIAQQRQRDISEVSLDLAKSNRLPSVNLSASYEVQGVGGNQFERGDLGGGERELVSQGGFTDALDQLTALDVPTWSFGVNFSYPIGFNTSRANRQRAEVQLRQADIAIRNQELAIVTQVTNAGLAVRNSFLQIEAARRSREAAERSFQAELARLDAGVSTNFEVVSIQNQLTAARLAELQATIAHVNAVAEFERVQRVGN